MKSDIEKAENLSNRFKRMNMFSDINRYAFDKKQYELLSYVRDVDREFEKNHDFDNEVPLVVVFEKLQEILPKVSKEEFDVLNSVLREYKLEKILKKPL